jgi:hypothetical protein
MYNNDLTGRLAKSDMRIALKKEVACDYSTIPNLQLLIFS